MAGSNEEIKKLKDMPDKLELKHILLRHRQWVEAGCNDEEDGCADLSYMIFQDGIDIKKDILSHPEPPDRGGTTQWAVPKEENLFLSCINFEGSILKRAKFGNAKLNKANFRGAFLDGAEFLGLELEGADFQGANLENTQFPNAKMQGANLQRARGKSTQFEKAELQEAQFQKSVFDDSVNFRGAKLKGADFTQAKLRKADFSGSDILGATFEEADLRDVKFENEVNGHTESQFSGTILTGCRLPTSIDKFEGLSNIEEVTQSGRKLFISLIVGCIYALLTIIGTKTESLLTDTIDSTLPIFQSKVKIVEFYQYSPLVLLFVYLWLHLYLQKNYWSRLATLPAFFPGGTRIDERIFPWHFSGFILKNFPHVRKMSRPFVSKVQYVLSILSFWCVVPFLIEEFWRRNLVIHDIKTTGWHIGLLLVSVISGWAFFILAIQTIQRKGNQNFWFFLKYSASRWVWGTSILCFLGCILVIGLSYGAISGHLTQPPFVADLKKADLSGINLAEVNLRNANLTGVNLQKTDLGGVYLEGAKLIDPKLEDTQFQGAHMQGVRLGFLGKTPVPVNSIFTGVDFTDAMLFMVDFSKSDLTGAVFERAWLRAVKFEDSPEIGFEDLKNTKTLYECILRVPLRDSVEKFRPELRKKTEFDQ